MRAVCLICAVGGAVAARWLWPRRYLPAALAGCVLLMGSAWCFKAYIGGDGLLFSGADAVLAAGMGYLLRRSPPEKQGAGRLVLVLAGRRRWAALCRAGQSGADGVGGLHPGAGLPGKGQAALGGAAAAAAGLCCAGPDLACGGVGVCLGAALGLFAQGDKLVCIAFYMGGALTGILAVQPPGAAFGYLAALGAGAAVCLLVPARLLLRDESLAHDPAESAGRPQLSAAATPG